MLQLHTLLLKSIIPPHILNKYINKQHIMGKKKYLVEEKKT